MSLKKGAVRVGPHPAFIIVVWVVHGCGCVCVRRGRMLQLQVFPLSNYPRCYPKVLRNSHCRTSVIPDIAPVQFIGAGGGIQYRESVQMISGRQGYDLAIPCSV